MPHFYLHDFYIVTKIQFLRFHVGDDYVSELHIPDRHIHMSITDICFTSQGIEKEEHASQGTLNEAFYSASDDSQTTKCGKHETICDPSVHKPSANAGSLRDHLKQV